jgi:hypothetical protein
LLWNGFLGFYYQNYLVLTIVGWIGVKDLRFSSEYTTSERLSSTMALLLAMNSVIFPLLIVVIYKVHYNKVSAKNTSNNKEDPELSCKKFIKNLCTSKSKLLTKAERERFD